MYHYIDNLKEGVWIYENPDYKEIGKYSADKQDSTWHSYYMPKGNKRFEGKFINGDPDGMHIWYYINGRKNFFGNYNSHF